MTTAALVGGLVLVAPPAFADTSTVVTTVAGGPGRGPAATLAQGIAAVAFTPTRIWVVEQRVYASPSSFVLRVVDRTTGLESGPVAVFPMPNQNPNIPIRPSLAALGNGNVLVAHTGEQQQGWVDEYAPSGLVRRVAGGGKSVLVGAGALATNSALGVVNGIAVSPSGAIYLAVNSYGYSGRAIVPTGSRIEKIGKGGRMTTVIGELGVGYLGDGGPAIAGQVSQAMGMTTDPAGNLYVADYGNHVVRRITPLGIISTVVQVSTEDVAWSEGSLYVGGFTPAGCAVQRWDGTAVVTVAGGGQCGWSPDGAPALSTRIYPSGPLAVDGTLVTFVQGSGPGASDGGYVRALAPDGTLQRLLGSGFSYHGGDGGWALDAGLSPYAGVATGPGGDVYVDEGAWLRRVDAASGTISTVAGSGGTLGSGGDGFPATSTAFRDLTFAVSPGGEVAIADQAGHRIYRIDGEGTLRTVAGTGQSGLAGEGSPATSAQVRWVDALAFGPNGDLYYMDGCLIRRIDGQGVLTTVAGELSSSGGCGTSADGTSAAGARVGYLLALTIDAVGRVVFAEDGFADRKVRIRRIGLDGVLSTLGGGGTLPPDGVAATEAALPYTQSLAVDPLGRLFLTDREGNRVLGVGTDGVVRTVVGSGPSGSTLGAALTRPSGLALDSAGALYVCAMDVSALGGSVVHKVTGL